MQLWNVTGLQLWNVMHFNYGLNKDTWHLIVNKQIAMTYERLLYERRIHKIDSEKKKLEHEVKMLEK